MIKKRILITGWNGLIGNILSGSLPLYPIRGFDLVATPPLADATNLNAILPFFEGIDVVIDLAAVSDQFASWETVYRNNIPATWNVLEASRRAGVKRVIFASSNHVTGLYEYVRPYCDIVAENYQNLDPTALPHISSFMPVSPDGPYAIGKACGEAIGKYFAVQHSLSVICLRIGTVNKENRPLIPRHFATWLSHRDLVHLVERCIEAPESVPFAVFYGVSNNKWRFWDIRNAEKLIGYNPKDNAEQWR